MQNPIQFYAPLHSEALPVLQQVEVATSFQLPHFQIIGLPGPEVAESKERVRSAIEAIGIEFPKRRVILNLSPANVKKRGTGADLAMALGILSISLKSEKEIKICAWGELGLDGKVKPVFQMTRALYSAWKGRVHFFVFSNEEKEDAFLALNWIRESEEFKDIPPPVLVSVGTLSEAWEKIQAIHREERHGGRPQGKRGKTAVIEKEGDAGAELEPGPPTSAASIAVVDQSPPLLLPISSSVQRLVGTVISGHHHFLIVGPRGAGKSHLLEWLIALQPPISAEMFLQTQLIAELGGKQRNGSQGTGVRLSKEAPVRKVSAHVRPAALLGNVSFAALKPGEFSLAHGGILIADELLEWARDSREALREPLESGKTTLTRAHGSFELPAQFLLVANGNLCPCGGWPRNLPLSEEFSLKTYQVPLCQCPDLVSRRYLSRLSGPILDRIDLVHRASPASVAHLKNSPSEGLLSKLRDQIQKAQASLIQSWGKLPGLLAGMEIESILRSDSRMEEALSRVEFSSLRSRHKIARIALTLAAWDEAEAPTEAHFLEAACYRPERILT